MARNEGAQANASLTVTVFPTSLPVLSVLAAPERMKSSLFDRRYGELLIGM
jgi:hypothetical protein